MADIAALDPTYVDGVLGLTNLGDNFGTVYFRYIPVKSERNLVVYEKVPVHYLVRPRAGACQAENCWYMRQIGTGDPPTPQPLRMPRR